MKYNFNKIINKININQILLQILISFCAIAILYFLIINFYLLNKGLDSGDESYYLLSYKMAFEGFYPHFTNTPFLVAKMFEWFQPKLVGYRIIHLLLSLLNAGIIILTINTYLKTTSLKLKSLEKLFLACMALFSSMYTYQISLTTLSYNHLNEFFYISSQACFFLAVYQEKISKKTIILLLISGLLACLDIFIKPPSFILLVLGHIVLAYLLHRKTKTYILLIFYFFTSLIFSFFLSLFFIMHPADWLAYFTFMESHTVHSPVTVLVGFFQSGLNILNFSIWFILFSLILVLLLNFKEKIKTFFNKYSLLFFIVIILTIISLIVLLITLVFSKHIGNWNSLTICFWWSVSLIFLLAVVIIFSISTLIINKFKIPFVFFILVINPIALALGSLNGFANVQIHSTSWLILISIIFIIFLRYSLLFKIKSYFTLLIIIYFFISSICFTKQIYIVNGSPDKLIYKIKTGVLKNIFVDKKTYILLNEINFILSKYPKAKTIVFFDAPVLQYAFNRQSIIKDPWLSNFQIPLTKDDLYNCKTITKEKNLKGIIFIVNRDKDISPKLKLCLQKIGYPDKLIFLGDTKISKKYMKEPIKIYLHP